LGPKRQFTRRWVSAHDGPDFDRIPVPGLIVDKATG